MYNVKKLSKEKFPGQQCFTGESTKYTKKNKHQFYTTSFRKWKRNVISQDSISETEPVRHVF